MAGTPELQVKWFKEGKQLMPSRYYTMSFENNVARFRLESVMKEDSGTYIFKVENDFGSSSCEAVLTVLGLYFVSLKLAEFPPPPVFSLYMFLMKKIKARDLILLAFPHFPPLGQVNLSLLHLPKS